MSLTPHRDDRAYEAAGRWQVYVGSPLGVAMLAWWATRIEAGADAIGWAIFGAIVALSLFSAWLTFFKLAWAVAVVGDQLVLRSIVGQRAFGVTEVRSVRLGRSGLPVVRTSHRWFAVQVRGARERCRFDPVAERLREHGVDVDLS